MYVTKELNPVLYWMIVVMIFAYSALIVKLLYDLFKTIKGK